MRINRIGALLLARRWAHELMIHEFGLALHCSSVISLCYSHRFARLEPFEIDNTVFYLHHVSRKRNNDATHTLELDRTRSVNQTVFAVVISTNDSPYRLNFLVLLVQTTLGVVTELAVLGSQSLRALLLRFAALFEEYENQLDSHSPASRRKWI